MRGERDYSSAADYDIIPMSDGCLERVDMPYTLQLPPAVVNDAKMYASSHGTTLDHLVKMYIIDLSTRKPETGARKLGIADGEFRMPTDEEDRIMDAEAAAAFKDSADEVFA